MLSLALEYLTGYAVATDTADRNRSEWPPHPARVFMAMAAAYFETGEVPAERDALLWLEQLGEHPTVCASECQERTLVTHYVPVNDELNPVGSTLPMLRRRQARGFPRVRPDDPRVYLVWDSARPDSDRLAALNSLCEKVTRIGHSSSLVRMWAIEGAPQTETPIPQWIADDYRFEEQLRVITPDSLDELRRCFRADDSAKFDELTLQFATAKGKAKNNAKTQLTERFRGVRPRPLRPEFGITVGYRRETPDAPRVAGSVWDQLLVFGIKAIESSRESSRARLDIRSTLAITKTLRDAAMSFAGKGDIPEALSGHKSDGKPSDTPHCAFMPLASVGHRYADGHLLGIGVAVPRGLGGAAHRRVLQLLGGVTELRLGPLGRWKIIPAMDAPDRQGLDPATWCAPPGGDRRWATVTPIAFDNHDKSNRRGERLDEIAVMVGLACTRAGLPEPQSVRVSHVSCHEGVPTAREFPRLPRKDGSLRRHAHARIVFSEPVRGPMLLGAGRYRGYGLCRPCKEGQS
ncbi:MAG TPA: type I-U CRISPR-associated protein Csb2 [Tepidisphaeraceae bacterium]|nr:type I-U CRISPR-associated protein Csb2 [Tepidisphaeraceae bacterium]